MRVAINGTGIAGPTLAYWLRQAGHDVLLIEIGARAPRRRLRHRFLGPRVRHRGADGPDPVIRELGYQAREVRFIDGHGRTSSAVFPQVFFSRLTNGRFTSLRRSDSSRSLHGALDGAVETMFGALDRPHRPGGAMPTRPVPLMHLPVGRFGRRRRRVALAGPPDGVWTGRTVRGVARLSRGRVRAPWATGPGMSSWTSAIRSPESRCHVCYAR